MPEVTLLPRTTAFGYHDHNLVTLLERRADHLPADEAPRLPRALLEGARQAGRAGDRRARAAARLRQQRPARHHVGRRGLHLCAPLCRAAGPRAVVFTNNDAGYDAALAAAGAGAAVRVVDARSAPSGSLSQRARAAGIEILAGHVVTEARGGKRVRGVGRATPRRRRRDWPVRRAASTATCSRSRAASARSSICIAKPAASRSGTMRAPRFVPGKRRRRRERSAGACGGVQGLQACTRDGLAAGAAAAQAAGFDATGDAAPRASTQATPATSARCGWCRTRKASAARPKQFVDLQNDVAASDIHLAVREGFESIEHVKRYTAMGFGTDQGKTGNINGMGIAAQALGKTIPQVGTTTFRPNYTPVTFGAVAGLELGDAFEPVRTTAHARLACRSTAPCSRTSANGSGPGTTREQAKTCMPR